MKKAHKFETNIQFDKSTYTFYLTNPENELDEDEKYVYCKFHG